MAEPLVAIDCRYVNGRASGIAEMVTALAKHLPALAPDLRFLLLRHPAGPPRLTAASNVEERILGHDPNGPLSMWALPRLVDLSGVGLFHATANMQPAGLTMPCITTVHDIMWLKHPQWAASGLRRLVYTPFYRHGIHRAFRRSERIATVSAATRDEILTVAPEAADRTRVTRSGVSRRFRRLRPRALQLPQPLTPGGYILTVGQHSPYKNHEAAVAAFARAFADRPDIFLVFLQRRGRGEARLRPLVERLGMTGRVRFLAPVSDSELVALYNGAAALLHPSFYEGFGNPLAEAMACGCPVVTSNVSVMPEVTAGAALLADPREPASFAAALRRIFEETGLAERLRERGLARAAELSWEGFAEANLALYRELL